LEEVFLEDVQLAFTFFTLEETLHLKLSVEWKFKLFGYVNPRSIVFCGNFVAWAFMTYATGLFMHGRDGIFSW